MEPLLGLQNPVHAPSAPPPLSGNTLSIVDSYDSYTATLEARRLDQKLQQPCLSLDVMDDLQVLVGSPESEELEGGKMDDLEGKAKNVDVPVDATTFQFHNCKYVAVYQHAFNAKGVKVEGSGNVAPKFIHNGEAVVVHHTSEILAEDFPSFSKLSQSKAAPGQSSSHQDFPPDFPFQLPSRISPLPLQPTNGSTSLYPRAVHSEPQNAPAMIPPGSRSTNPFLKEFKAPADRPLSTFQASISPRKREKLPASFEKMPLQGDDAILRLYTPKLPVPKNSPNRENPPFPIDPFSPTHMGLYPKFVPHVIPLPGEDQLPPFINEGAQLFPQLHPRAALGLSSRQSESPVGIPPGSRRNNPFLNQFPVVPTDISLLTFEEGQTSISPRKRGHPLQTTTRRENDATLRQHVPNMPGERPMTLPGPELQPFHSLHAGFNPKFLSHILQDVQNAPPNNIGASNRTSSSQPNSGPPHTNSKHLEQLLESALATALIIQTESGISTPTDILTTRAQNTLNALNALVSVEQPVSEARAIASDSSTHGRVLAKWLRISKAQISQ